MRLARDTMRGLTDISRVVGGAKDELRCAVVSGADVADIGLASYEDLGRAKVTELENACCGVEQKVLGLDITVADAGEMNISERTEKLVHIKFDLKHRHGLLELGVVTACAVHGFRNVLENKVEVDLVFLCGLD
jgi:hypothetical protein